MKIKVILSIVFNLASQIIMFFFIPYLGRLKGVDYVGDYAAVVSIGSFLGTIFILRSELVVINKDNAHSNSNMFVCLCFSLLVFILVTVLSNINYGLFSYGFFLLLLTQVYLSNLKMYAVSAMVKLLSSLLFVSFFFIFYDCENASLLQALSMVIISLLVILRKRTEIFNMDFISTSVFTRFVLQSKFYVKYTFPNTIIAAAISYMTPLAILYIFGQYESGVFFMLFKLMMAPVTIVGLSVGQIVRKEFTFNKGEELLVWVKYKKLLSLLVLSSFFYMLFFYFIMENYIELILSSDWSLLRDIYHFFMLVPVIMIVFVPLSQIYMTMNKQKYDLIFQFFGLISTSFLFLVSGYYKLTLNEFLLYYSSLLFIMYFSSIIFLTFRVVKPKCFKPDLKTF